MSSLIALLHLVMLMGPSFSLGVSNPQPKLSTKLAPFRKEWPVDVSKFRAYMLPGSDDCKVRCDGSKCSLSCARGGPRLMCTPSYLNAGCCTTCKIITAAPPYMTGSSGFYFYPVHQPSDGAFQLVVIGTCGSWSGSACGSGGRCTTRYHGYPILVSAQPVSSAQDLAETETWYEFEYLPSHCECQNWWNRAYIDGADELKSFI